MNFKDQPIDEAFFAGFDKQSFKIENPMAFSEMLIKRQAAEIDALKTRLAEVEKDAELGRIAMRFVDRAGDVHPGIDDAETICAEFYKAMADQVEKAFGAAMNKE